MTGSRSLSLELRRQVENVDERVRRAGGEAYAYKEDARFVRIAVDQILKNRLHEQLGLGEFVGSLAIPELAKAQLLLRFKRSENERDAVLKVYGYQRVGEGVTQKAMTDTGLASVVPTHDYSDDPTTWILMDFIDGRPLGGDLDDPELRDRRTRELGRAAGQLHQLPVPHVPGMMKLAEDLMPNLRVAMASLARHGYEVPDGWERRALRAYEAGPPETVHTDLSRHNVMIDADDRLRLLDICGRVGDGTFDLARWLVREYEPENFDRGRRAWESGLGRRVNDGRFRDLLVSECLMQAGVIETIKDEDGLDWRERDPRTLSFLAAADHHAERAQNLQ